MTKARSNDQLRKKAEEIMRQRGQVDLDLYSTNLEEVLEELKIYHIELEHQNQELQRVSQEREEAITRVMELYNSSPAGYITLDEDFTIIQVNDTFANMIQKEKGRLLNTPFTKILTADSQDPFYLHINDVKKHPGRKLAAFIFLKSISGVMECRIESVVPQESGADGLRVNISLMDVTREKAQEREVAREREIWQHSFAAVKDTLLIIDPDSVVIDANLSAAELFSRPKTEIIGRKYYELIHGRECADESCEVCRAIPEQRSEYVETYEPYLEKHLSVSASPLMRDGEAACYTLTLRDITERKHHEEAMAANEKRFRTIFEQSVVAICLTDEQGRYEMVNQAYLDLYRYTEDELVGKHFSLVVPDEYKEKMSRMHDRFIEKKVEVRGEWTVVDKYGGEHTILADAAHISGPDGEAKKLTFVLDITERKRAIDDLAASEEQLKQLNATKDKFFSIVAHDLKNPINVILNFSDILADADKTSDPEDVNQTIGYIREGARSIYKLLENLLLWSRSQSDRIHFDPQTVDLRSIITANISFLKGQAAEKKINLSSGIPEKCAAKVDSNMIDTVVRNLISNAIKYTGEGGAITVSAARHGDRVRVAVADSGVGMSPQIMESLFDISTNTSRPGTNREQGTGLGLILCKEFIDKHGGRIWAESEPGKGTTVYFEV